MQRCPKFAVCVTDIPVMCNSAMSNGA